MRLDDIKDDMADQGLRMFEDSNGDWAICDTAMRVVATQPGDVSELQAAVVLALTTAGFVWPS